MFQVTLGNIKQDNRVVMGDSSVAYNIKLSMLAFVNEEKFLRAMIGLKRDLYTF